MVSSDHLKPGEKGEITATVDVRGKLGKITKTIQVRSNDPKRPQVTLILTMQVKDKLHSRKYNADEIFKNSCQQCHVGAGRDKKGITLFNANCAMCHKAGTTSMQNLSEDRLRKYIEDGVTGSSMPGWVMSKGGPLTKEDIDSLIESIKGRK
ncbi:MAG: c-type cytochrome [Nitrospirae bacterium]|nr:c-type cytochrome [Nitrospirota bacterium]